MKTNFRFLALSAAILSMFTACQREELEQNQKPEALTHSVTFVAGAPETKTIATIEGNTVNYAWTADDENENRFTVFENGVPATEVLAELDTEGKMSMTATFSGDVPASPKYQALYNSEVSANQNIVKNSYAEESDVMVSNVLDGTRNDNFIFSFKREVAFAKMTLKCLTSGAYVSSVKIESDKPIAGQYDLETGTFVNTSNVITLDVLTDVANGNATVWFTTIPVEDATFTITAKTTNDLEAVAATYTKTFSKTITLTRGDVKAFGVAMVKEPIVAPEPVVLYCSDVTTSGYVSNATHVVNTSLPFEYLQIMANGKNSPTGYGAGQVMQFKSSLGEIYNTESFGSPVKYVEVYAQSSNPFYVYYGDSKAPSENKISRPTTASGTKTISIEDNYGNKNVEEEVNYYLLNLSSYNANYVRIVNGSSTNYFYKIVLRFDEPETVRVTGITLDKTEVTINEGETTTLTATIAPSDATTKDITWASDNETVATVTDGVVSGLSAGSATITATTVDGEFTASCVVTVNELSKISTIAEIKAILKKGTSSSDTRAFDARLTRAVVTYVNDNNAFIEDESAAILYYKSGHGLKVGDVLSGDFAGSGYSRYGVVEITSVTTNPTITEGTAPDPTVATLAQISENFDAYDSRWIKLESVTTGVALASGTRTSTVSQNGISLPLYAKIKNTELAAESFGDMICIPCYNNTTKQIGFWEATHFSAKTVAVTGVTLDKSEVSITVGKTATLTATITPSNATNKNVSWSSNAEDVATVANGVVTAVAVGKAKITVTTEDGNYTADCVVTVTAASPDGELTQYSENFSHYQNTSTSNTVVVSEFNGDACKWSGIGATTTYYTNTDNSEGTTGVTLLKPASNSSTYIISEQLQNGVSKVEITAHSNNTSASLKVYVVTATEEILLGEVKTTSKKTKFSSSWDVNNISGSYQIKIANENTAAYINFTGLKWTSAN